MLHLAAPHIPWFLESSGVLNDYIFKWDTERAKVKFSVSLHCNGIACRPHWTGCLDSLSLVRMVPTSSLIPVPKWSGLPTNALNEAILCCLPALSPINTLSKFSCGFVSINCGALPCFQRPHFYYNTCYSIFVSFHIIFHLLSHYD